MPMVFAYGRLSSSPCMNEMRLLAILAIVISSRVTQPAHSQPTISIGIFAQDRFSACSLSGRATLAVQDQRGERVAELLQGAVLRLAAEGDRVFSSWEQPPGEGQAERYVVTSAEPVTVTPEGRGTRTYRGAIAISTHTGHLLVVNEIALEDYLRGVLPAEIPTTFHPEALKAQAIAARTYALANLRKHRAEGFDLCDRPHCQVYSGVVEEDSRADAAIRDTEGLIVTYQSQPIHAVYHDACGGRTAASETAWPGSEPLPYLRPVVDGAGDAPWCARSPRLAWTRQVSQEKLGRALARFGVQGPVTAIEPAECDENGRPKQYRVKAADREWTILAGALRSAVNAAVGWDTLPSADFQAAPNGDSLVFAGRGNGHGVGLCQWGANEMAKAGKTAEEILKHYYQGVTVERICEGAARPTGG